jgi:hypothetical protein
VPASSPRSLVRAAGIGFGLACFVGGVFLLVMGALGTFGRIDCAALLADQCRLLQAARWDLARLQALAGAALLLLGAATALFVRRG